MSGIWSNRRTVRVEASAGLIGLAGVLLAAGCAGTGGSATDHGSFTYVRGDLEFSLPVSLDRARAAADAAVADLGHVRLSEDADGAVAVLVSRDAEERRIQIRLESTGPERTDARIRVGILGDQAVSIRVRDAIRAQF